MEMTKVCSGSGLAVWDPIASLGGAVVAAAPRGAQVLNSVWRLSFRSTQRFHPVNTKHTIVNLYIYSLYSPTLQNISKPSSAQQTIQSCSNFENCSHPTTTTTLFLILLHQQNRELEGDSFFAKTEPNFIRLQIWFCCVIFATLKHVVIKIID